MVPQKQRVLREHHCMILELANPELAKAAKAAEVKHRDTGHWQCGHCVTFYSAVSPFVGISDAKTHLIEK